MSVKCSLLCHHCVCCVCSLCFSFSIVVRRNFIDSGLFQPLKSRDECFIEPVFETVVSATDCSRSHSSLFYLIKSNFIDSKLLTKNLYTMTNINRKYDDKTWLRYLIQLYTLQTFSLKLDSQYIVFKNFVRQLCSIFVQVLDVSLKINHRVK